MPYKVYKMLDDARNKTCGMFIPNGGWYQIVEMRFENRDKLANIGARAGYSVDFVCEVIPEGLYSPDGELVDPNSVVVDPVFKTVKSWSPLDKESLEQNEATDERQAAIAMCNAAGVKIDNRWSTQKIKDAYTEARVLARSSTLAPAE